VTFRTLLTHPAVQAVGWALLHFIWQGALLAAVLVLANTLTRLPRVRYAIACIVMLLMPVVFVATILRNDHPAAQYPLEPGYETAIANTPVATDPGRAAIAAPIASAAKHPNELALVPGSIVCVWLIGVLAFSLYTTVGWMRLRQLTRSGAEPVNQAWLETLADLMRRLRISRPVRLYISAVAEVPAVIGWIRPYIVLPVSAVTGLNESQLRAVLAHELAHIRRYDYLVNLLQNAAETLFFYHPAVWWVSRRIRHEREHCCDDLAVELSGDVMVYANALAQLEELRGSIPEPALAATGGDLLARIRRLTGQDRANRHAWISGFAGAILAAALVVGAVIITSTAPAIQAQSPPPPVSPAPAASVPTPPRAKAAARPKFDAASVKPCNPTDGAGGGRDGRGGGGHRYLNATPGRLHITCMSVSDLIQVAYVQFGGNPLTNDSSGPFDEKRLRGGPSWAYSDRYTIEAVTGDSSANKATDDPFVFSPASRMIEGPMLQALLEDRFQLKTHREMEETPMYAMTVGKNGLKLKPMAEGDCLPDGPPEWLPGGKPPCGWIGWGVNGPNRTLLGGGVQVNRISQVLGDMIMDRPVIDQTGITAVFSVRIEYAPDESTPMNGLGPGRQPVDPSSDIPPGASIFTALEQLGLKLSPTRGQHGFIVIDRVARPSEN